MEYFEALVCHATTFVRDGVFIASQDPEAPQAIIVWSNGRLSKVLNHGPANLVGTSLSDLLDTTCFVDGVDPFPSEEGQMSRYRMKRPSNKAYCFDIELDVHALGCQSDNKHYWAGVVVDVSERVQAQEKFERVLEEAETARKRLWHAVEALPDAFLMLDKDDRLIAFNEKFREFYAHSSPAIYEGASFGDIMRYGLENGQYPEAIGNEDAWLAERLDRSSRLNGPINRKLPDDRYLIIHDVETENGDIVGLRTDVTEFKLQQQALEESGRALEEAIAVAETASRTDGLTGLSNRRGLDLHLQLLTRSDARAEEIALIHIDLDRFKAINDVFGHAAGDHVLKEVATILENSVRPGDFMARVGGDEFVVVASSNRHTQRVAEGIASRIIGKCKKPVWYEEKELRFGASIGIAVARITELVGLMENADIALYEAKAAGRNQYALFTPELRAQVEEKRTLADELLKGIAEDQIIAHFQPQVSCEDRSLIGAEALARWDHPVMGLVPPDIFLPVAEELGLLGDIDDIVLSKSISAVQHLVGAGLSIPKISVNVSYRRLKTHDLSKRLEELRPWPCRLAFELLETIDFDQDATEFDWILDGLREQGVELELDDFGSGRASITTLLRLRPDRIKIDRQLVTAVRDETIGANPLVQAIGEMGKAIGLKMTAEGVETDVQATVMHQLGCDVLQGHLIAPAMSEQDLRRWISSRNPINTARQTVG